MHRNKRWHQRPGTITITIILSSAITLNYYNQNNILQQWPGTVSQKLKTCPRQWRCFEMTLFSNDTVTVWTKILSSAIVTIWNQNLSEMTRNSPPQQWPGIYNQNQNPVHSHDRNFDNLNQIPVFNNVKEPVQSKSKCLSSAITRNYYHNQNPVLCNDLELL